MEYWQRNKDGKHFDNEEDAYLDCLDNEDEAVLENYLRDFSSLSFGDLLHWAMGEQAFWEHFQDEITETREMIFDDNYSYWIESPNETETNPTE